MTTLDEINLRPRDASQALHSLELLAEHLNRHGDARAVFIDVYAIITRKVVDIERRDDHGFINPRWLSELTGRFAEEALVAVSSSLTGQPINSAAWRYATHCTTTPPPYCGALLGINAHINYDLGLVVYRYFAEHSTGDAQLPQYWHDYTQVNKLLTLSVHECLDLLAERYACASTRRVVKLGGSGPIAAAIMNKIVAWRDHVWRDVVALRHAPNERARNAIISRIDHRSGRIGLAILGRTSR